MGVKGAQPPCDKNFQNETGIRNPNGRGIFSRRPLCVVNKEGKEFNDEGAAEE